MATDLNESVDKLATDFANMRDRGRFGGLSVLSQERMRSQMRELTEKTDEVLILLRGTHVEPNTQLAGAPPN